MITFVQYLSFVALAKKIPKYDQIEPILSILEFSWHKSMIFYKKTIRTISMSNMGKIYNGVLKDLGQNC